MRIDAITIFPDYLAPLSLSLVGKAQAAGLLDVHVHDLRTYATDRHRTVDDTPYGGGAGMVMKPEPWGAALDAVLASGADAQDDDAQNDTDAVRRMPRLVVPTPSGRPFTQQLARDIATEPWLVFACGRYEGIDGRVVDWAATRVPVDEVSLGDFVVNGGEVAVLAMVEAVARLLPGFVGNPDSLVEESHADGLLEYPVYTKPPQWRDREVPPVLRSGNHGRVARWRRDEALRRTARNRPDLIEALDPATLNAKDRSVLYHLGWAPDETSGFLRRMPPLAE